MEGSSVMGRILPSVDSRLSILPLDAGQGPEYGADNQLSIVNPAVPRERESGLMIQAVHVPESAEDAWPSTPARGGWIMGGGTIVMPLVNSGAAPATELVSLRRAGLRRRRGPRRGDQDRRGGDPRRRRVSIPGLAFLRPALRDHRLPDHPQPGHRGRQPVRRPADGDLAVCLLALDATCEIAGPGGRREAPVADVLTSGVARGRVRHGGDGFALPEPVPGATTRPCAAA